MDRKASRMCRLDVDSGKQHWVICQWEKKIKKSKPLMNDERTGLKREQREILELIIMVPSGCDRH